MPGIALEHRFNDDLLIGKDDQAYARASYAEIYHVLDHAELRKEFLRYDDMARSSKRWVHGVGLVATLLAVTALLASAVTPLLRQFPGVPSWVWTALVCAEVGGILGLLVAAGGLWIGGKKKDWLECRMMAEVLRLWHFQSLICCGTEIESSCDATNPGAREAFAAYRKTAFKKFLQGWEGVLDSRFTEIVETPGGGQELLQERVTPYSAGSPVLLKVFEAYDAMRFGHQSNYAHHKLQRSTARTFAILKWPAAVLQERMQRLASTFLLVSLACSAVIVAGHLLHLPFASHAGWPAAIVALLILTVATRAVQDGLAAPAELQRYSD